LLWEPLREALPVPAQTVFLAPDAALTRLPFAALPGQKPGSVLLEDHALAVVPHGPFLLDQLTSPARFDKGRDNALALGGVAYGEEPAPLDMPISIRGPERAGAVPTWSDLPGTARELKLLGRLYGARVIRLEGNRADAGRLLQALPGVSLAHLSTHGFFNERLFRQEQERSRQQADSLILAQEVLPEGHSPGITQGMFNPLSYTGLVLAGANQPQKAGLHGGILTGEALLTVDLRQLELAVLSACQTGLGEVANGECVHNLQQAFHSAGCPNVIAALWSVPDQATAALMGLFYHALLVDKQTPLEALRSAQLYLYRHPEKVSELAQRLERGAPQLAQGVKVAQPDTTPTPPTVENKRSAVKDWAAFVLSVIGR
jgi:CHAT domain-containing protein